MADLPDLDTTSIGLLGYWNAIDQGGVPSIDPEEATSAGNLASTTIYDNGFDGQYNGPNGRTFNVRVKSDGWILAWLDTTNETGTGLGNKPTGLYDAMNKWANTDYSANGGTYSESLLNGSLEQAINELRTEMSNQDLMDYANTEVGYYSFPYPDATAMTGFGGSLCTDQGSPTWELQYTAGTDLYYWVGTGYVKTSGNTYSVSHNGVTVVNGSGPEYGVVDVANTDNVLVDPGTTFPTETSQSNNFYQDWLTATSFAIWG